MLTHTYKASLKDSCTTQSLWNALEVHVSAGGDCARPKRWKRKLTVPEPKARSRNRTGRRRSEISEELRAEVCRLAEPVKNRFTLLDVPSHNCG
jgi:hypothetical protein